MFLDDAFQHDRGTVVIPRAFGIDDGDGPAHANAQATGFGAIDQRLRADETKFFQPTFQKIPRGQCLFARTAFGFTGIGAKKDVAAKCFEAERGGGGL